MFTVKDLLFGSEEELAADSEQAKAAEGAIVTKDMLVGEIVMKYPAASEFLMRCGMGCIYCPSAQMESLEMAAMVHGLDADDICNALNLTLAGAADEDKASGDDKEGADPLSESSEEA